MSFSIMKIEMQKLLIVKLCKGCYLGECSDDDNSYTYSVVNSKTGELVAAGHTSIKDTLETWDTPEFGTEVINREEFSKV